MAKKIFSTTCNYDIDYELLTTNFDERKKEKNDDVNDEVKMMIPRRRHTTAEKKSADAKWRVNFTGKKHHEDRTREDYKMAKVENEWKRDIRSYSRGGYDRNGIIQNRRYNEAVEDAMKDFYGREDVNYEVYYYSRLLTAREDYQSIVNRLQKECDIVNWMNEKMLSDAKDNNFIYRPRVESYAFKALKDAEATLEAIDADIDCYRRTGDMNALRW